MERSNPKVVFLHVPTYPHIILHLLAGGQSTTCAEYTSCPAGHKMNTAIPLFQISCNKGSDCDQKCTPYCILGMRVHACLCVYVHMSSIFILPAFLPFFSSFAIFIFISLHQENESLQMLFFYLLFCPFVDCTGVTCPPHMVLNECLGGDCGACCVSK